MKEKIKSLLNNKKVLLWGVLLSVLVLGGIGWAVFSSIQGSNKGPSNTLADSSNISNLEENTFVVLAEEIPMIVNGAIDF